MENQKLASISEYQTKEYILDLMEQIKDALNDNDFEQIQNLSDMIVRECNEFID